MESNIILLHILESCQQNRIETEQAVQIFIFGVLAWWLLVDTVAGCSKLVDQQQEDIHDNQTDVIAVPALEAEVPKNIRKTINQNEYVTKIEKSNANKPKQTQEEPTQQHNRGINKYKQKCH